MTLSCSRQAPVGSGSDKLHPAKPRRHEPPDDAVGVFLRPIYGFLPMCCVLPTCHLVQCVGARTGGPSNCYRLITATAEQFAILASRPGYPVRPPLIA